MRNGRKKNSVGIAFAHHYILQQSSTLIVHFNFSSSRSFMFFWRPKERKAPAHLKSSPPFLCSGVAGRHPSVKPGAKAHSFGELKLILSKFGCTQHSANKFASAFVCTNFPVVANIARPQWCHLNLSVDFWVMRTFLSQSLAFSEHLTSGRTFLSLYPKFNRLQAVSFNGAGLYLILPLYA